MPNYNRYLDLHLCCTQATWQNNHIGERPERGTLFTSGPPTSRVTYYYDFNDDIQKQMEYRTAKTEGYTHNEKNTGNSRVIEEELTHADVGFLHTVSHVDVTALVPTPTQTINAELKTLRYISCRVAMEHLKTAQIYPQLQALMLWISDPTTLNKVRINSHGMGVASRGMRMGGEELSADQLVSALVRHGLTRPSTRAVSALGLAQNARWKEDNEKDRCEGCNKRFIPPFVRKHHCRRCGGLFCDSCSSNKADLAVALTGEKSGKAGRQTATANNVKNVRVCNNCYRSVGNSAVRALVDTPGLQDVFGESVGAATGETIQANYGLKTICLALCLGARSDDQYSVEKQDQGAGAFVRDSLAGQLISALRTNNLRGIKVTASNQVVASGAQGVMNQDVVEYPTARTKTSLFGPTKRILTRVNTDFTQGNGIFCIPAYIWGDRAELRTQFNTVSRMRRTNQLTGDIFVAPDGKSLYFSKTLVQNDLQEVRKDWFIKWKFLSWHNKDTELPPLPGAPAVHWTVKITAPPRVTRIQALPGGPGENLIKITARVGELTKDFKSYEES